jgi:UPF0716 protein FxsA
VRYAVIVFIAVPLIEMLLLFEVADVIGGMSTLGLVVLTAVIGVQILKRQGFSTLARAQSRLQTGELPAQEIVEGMLLAGAGALLLTPGFITDTLGFIFLTGPLRRPLARRIIRSGMVRTMGAGSARGGFSYHEYHARGNPDRQSGQVYEGEYSDESRKPLPDED